MKRVTSVASTFPLLKNLPKEAIPGEENSLFDLYFDLERKCYNIWNSKYLEYRIPADTQFHQIFIPTTDSCRHHQLLTTLALHHFPVAFIGKTGVGKTAIIKKFLLYDLDPTKYFPTIVN